MACHRPASGPIAHIRPYPRIMASDGCRCWMVASLSTKILPMLISAVTDCRTAAHRRPPPFLFHCRDGSTRTGAEHAPWHNVDAALRRRVRHDTSVPGHESGLAGARCIAGIGRGSS